MSSISSTGSSSSLWYLLNAQQAAATTGQTGSGTSASGTASSTSGSSSIDPSNLRSQIETAVTGALSNLSPTSTGQVLQAVGGAINSTLQDNGINPSQFQAHGHHGHHHHAQSSQDLLGSSSLDDSDGDDSTNGIDSNNSDGITGKQRLRSRPIRWPFCCRLPVKAPRGVPTTARRVQATHRVSPTRWLRP